MGRSLQRLCSFSPFAGPDPARDFSHEEDSPSDDGLLNFLASSKLDFGACYRSFEGSPVPPVPLPSSRFPPHSLQVPEASSWAAKGRGARSLFHLHPFQAVVLAERGLGSPFFPVLWQNVPSHPPLTSVCLKTGKPCFWGADGKVDCRGSCSLRTCSVVLLAATEIYC